MYAYSFNGRSDRNKSSKLTFGIINKKRVVILNSFYYRFDIKGNRMQNKKIAEV